jgi:hypothetical protein
MTNPIKARRITRAGDVWRTGEMTYMFTISVKEPEAMGHLGDSGIDG